MPDVLHPLDVLIRKRDGHPLSPDEIRLFVAAVVRAHSPSAAAGTGNTQVSDAQIAAFLMAVFFRGLSPVELDALTEAMRSSGETLHAPAGFFTVDKHSTGGVGDKTSLLLAPILAAASLHPPSPGLPPVAVPMISGRSLGHTGGTLDKLETIPGFNTQLPLPEIARLLPQTRAVLVGQTPTLVPADRVLYALRDHTGTVESPFLITASIMSKKLAEDLRGLVLDVKFGSGAFLSTPEAARHLAQLLVNTGNRAGTRTVALLTAMEQPLGRFAGNWVEVAECVDILQGRRHPLSADLLELTLALAGHMLRLAGYAATAAEGALLADRLLATGQAYAAWLEIVRAQGGDTGVFAAPWEQHHPTATRVVQAPRAGFLAGMDCKQIGWAVQRLGAGRARPGDPVSAHAGLEVHRKLGSAVEEGEPIFTLFAEDAALLEEPVRLILDTLEIAPEPAGAGPLIAEILDGVQDGTADAL
jgi:pyrimidine-nucleoside phosphorylase